mmetsp:Transcript_3107/g.10846  ORF Transcript_3107/g.10846 Transcript_3107/m.10846 type:complete len:319 (+) Transcript_3107:259-1215(+)
MTTTMPTVTGMMTYQGGEMLSNALPSLSPSHDSIRTEKLTVPYSAVGSQVDSVASTERARRTGHSRQANSMSSKRPARRSAAVMRSKRSPASKERSGLMQMHAFPPESETSPALTTVNAPGSERSRELIMKNMAPALLNLPVMSSAVTPSSAAAMTVAPLKLLKLPSTRPEPPTWPWLANASLALICTTEDESVMVDCWLVSSVAMVTLAPAICMRPRWSRCCMHEALAWVAEALLKARVPALISGEPSSTSSKQLTVRSWSVSMRPLLVRPLPVGTRMEPGAKRVPWLEKELSSATSISANWSIVTTPLGIEKRDSE